MAPHRTPARDFTIEVASARLVATVQELMDEGGLVERYGGERILAVTRNLGGIPPFRRTASGGRMDWASD